MITSTEEDSTTSDETELPPKRRRIYSDGASTVIVTEPSSSDECFNSFRVNVRRARDQDLVFMNNYKDTELHTAIKANNLELVKQILISGVDFNASGEDGNTPLYKAVERRYSDIVKLLVEYGADITGKIESNDESFWETPLHLAVKNNWLDILKLLLTTEINLEKLSTNRDKHLDSAIKSKNFKLINRLQGVSTDVYNEKMLEAFRNVSMLQFRKMGYSGDMIALLFGKYNEINARNKSDETLLLLAVKNNNTEIIKYLLESGADVNANSKKKHSLGWTALHWATLSSFVETVDLLLAQKDCDVNVRTSYGATPLHFAASRNLDIVKKLVRKNAGLDFYGGKFGLRAFTPYHTAVYVNRIDIVKYFLEDVKVDVNKLTLDNESALQIAINRKNENFEMVEYLIERGANINYSSQERKQTALHLAAKKADVKLVEFLLKKGADVNVMGSGNRSVLLMAVYGENENIVKLILGQGANVNPKSTSHYFEELSPLMEASSKNLKEIVLMLITAGADLTATAVNIKTRARHSVIDFVINGIGDADLLTMLLNLGADINQANIYKREDLPKRGWDVLKKHIRKLKVAGLYVSEKHLLWAKYKWDSSLDNEVRKMKIKKIGNSNVCFYDLLVKDLDQLVKYAENSDIRQAVKLEKIKYLFPLYADMLICCFNKGLVRCRLLNEAERVLAEFFVGLPHCCVRQILLELSNDDLKICSEEKVKL